MPRFHVALPLGLGVALSALLSPPTTAPAWAASLDAASAIRQVTVYPDRASVTRVVRMNLPAGPSRIHFKRLPGRLLSDSVRVAGQGNGLLILGSQHRTGTEVSGASELPKKLREQIQQLEDRVAANRAEVDVHERQLQAFRTAVARAGSGLADQLAAGKARVGEWEGLMGYLARQQQNEAKAIQSLNLQHRGLLTQLTKAREDLRKAENGGGESQSEVVVELESAQAGLAELSVEYVVPGASWSPTYDARLDVAGNRFEWRAYGQVRQQTGEDWRGVRLRLSTASPAAGSNPPAVPSWTVGHGPRFDVPGYSGNIQQSNRMQERARNLAPAAPIAMADAAPADEAMEPVAMVRDLGTSTVLEVERPADVPSDNQAHQHYIGRAPLAPSLSYRVVPRVRPEAYVQVDGLHPGPWPLLPGSVKAFVGGDYVGTTPLPLEVLPNGRFTLAMGVDRGIQVRRQRVGKTTGTGGMLNRVGYAEYRFEVAVTNQKPSAQKVHVLEAIPQSTEGELQVKLLDASHPKEATSLPGQAHWVLNLKPGEKQLLRWGYRVEWPAEQGMPYGLE